MAGDEPRVVAAFCNYLKGHGWDLAEDSGDCDIVAARSGQALYVEVKGDAGDFGTDLDIAYGQILRRMTDLSACFAVVVPTKGVTAALRVPAAVRERLNIHVYEVSDAGTVRCVGPDGSNPL
ncbi:hypothetical protein [Actinomadura decatromicini]|uniref:Restriction endonuclease n=1 Tax=Actinomadura decatromicini TaxID=2604572 RepID=A0A5D3FAD4_9ACTN|nr:hypothetical protein [Actinomadura decatromicini]TYK45173.1 hypothetical protein FXF68_31335 [Actinomadura decatromicini]